MTDLEITILQTIHNQKYCEAHRKILYDLNKSNPEMIKSTINDLLKLGLIEAIPLSNCYKLSGSGLNALRLAKKERENDTKQESQQRFDNKISVANLLVPFVIFILGFFVNLIISLFK